MAHAAEKGHWYTKTGEPMYTVIGANGNERNTTLRDARKLELVPSVTTVMNIADKPGLNRWKVDQALMAALTLPRIEGESLDAFKKRAAEDAEQHAKDAAQRGTDIHTVLQSYYEGGRPDDMHMVFATAVDDAITKEFGDSGWTVEASFCSPLGYGGKVDLHRPDVVLDFKTKEFGPDDKVKAYDEQIMQLDAYRHGLGIPSATLANVFISVSNPGLVQIVTHAEGNHFERFKHLLAYWKLSKNYDPAGG